MIDLADQVKSLVPVRDAAEYYGFRPNRTGYICCPFHDEKTASLKLYDGQQGFHCFGCGAHGSVIDFVMNLFGIPFRQAVVRLNTDFGLGLTAERPSPAQQAKVRELRRREARREAELEHLLERYRELAVGHRYWWNVLKAGIDHPLYAEAVKKQPYLEYLLDELEEMIGGAKSDRGRKDAAIWKHSAGGPGQTA